MRQLFDNKVGRFNVNRNPDKKQSDFQELGRRAVREFHGLRSRKSMFVAFSETRL
jgi:hypothetical protein